ncbi:hypothetical protein DIPPA_09474 [Diplonema papillatum]|nr:hypothetical protein DIPPA_09474 [Diplonema papillatum]
MLRSRSAGGVGTPDLATLKAWTVKASEEKLFAVSENRSMRARVLAGRRGVSYDRSLSCDRGVELRNAREQVSKVRDDALTAQAREEKRAKETMHFSRRRRLASRDREAALERARRRQARETFDAAARSEFLSEHQLHVKRLNDVLVRKSNEESRKIAFATRSRRQQAANLHLAEEKRLEAEFARVQLSRQRSLDETKAALRRENDRLLLEDRLRKSETRESHARRDSQFRSRLWKESLEADKRHSIMSEHLTRSCNARSRSVPSPIRFAPCTPSVKHITPSAYESLLGRSTSSRIHQMESFASPPRLELLSIQLAASTNPALARSLTRSVTPSMAATWLSPSRSPSRIPFRPMGV